MQPNADQSTIKGFGNEWKAFDQSSLNTEERDDLFNRYFRLFPWDRLPDDATGFDMGCGSGRWAMLVAPRVSRLHCIDPSEALEVSRSNLAGQKNCVFHAAGVGETDLEPGSMDFGYSLGVLHHGPDTPLADKECVKLLKPGAPFLLYLYYDFENRGTLFKMIWRSSELLRRLISRLPFRLRYLFTQIIALLIYLPLARLSALLFWLGLKTMSEKMPLSAYRYLSFYTMRTDSLDRFGTRLEKRFSKAQITQMLEDAGLSDISFSDEVPYWVSIGYKS